MRSTTIRHSTYGRCCLNDAAAVTGMKDDDGNWNYNIAECEQQFSSHFPDYVITEYFRRNVINLVDTIEQEGVQKGRKVFGRPQLDTCCECEELQVRVESPILNETAKRVAEAQLIVHKRKSNKCYASLKQMKEYCKDKDNEREKSLQYQHTTTSSGQRRNGYIEALPYIGGLQTKHFLFAFGAEIALPNQKAYTDCQPITEDKVRDQKSLLPDFPKHIHIFMAKKANDAISTTRSFSGDGIGDSEMGPRIRHKFSDIRLTVEENLGKNKPSNQAKRDRTRARAQLRISRQAP
ncbi:hypothetical protein ANN_21022 [Periplaneta americana]|uniref:Uncharacterized protein n=1 Tax=Periplaneta americana TaxID=6978 RepID=A0ABQ8SE83_PERAM|nr:hypothetical protein ANN_21022 [Periplaneta americana]